MANRQFSGSQVKADFIPLPNAFFTKVVPKIQDVNELKVILYVFYLLVYKSHHHVSRQIKGGDKVDIPPPSFVTYRDLLDHRNLIAGMDEAKILQALGLAVEHGFIIRTTLDMDKRAEDVYSLKIDSTQLPAFNIFTLYEQNIGMITPMLAEELKEAERLYPALWIEEAFKEAVMLNKRSWRYIARILERWVREGKEIGEDRQSNKKGGTNKYVRGKYGHLVRR